MFGTITVDKPELKIKEFELYHSYYCGLCRSLGSRTGLLSHLTLSYDMTFLALLLTDLYDEEPHCCTERCPIRPWLRCRKADNRFIAYASDMNVLLSWYNLLDDWYDDRDVRAYALVRALKPAVRRLRREYPRQAKAVSVYMKKLRQCESEAVPDLDLAAGLTGEMLGEIFVFQEDIWAERLRRIGFFLGKYIYLLDAWEDLEEDTASGSYNPWKSVPAEQRTPDAARDLLRMMLGEACRAFEQLPTIDMAPILRNILYSGIWSKFEKSCKEGGTNGHDGSVQGSGRQIRCFRR